MLAHNGKSEESVSDMPSAELDLTLTSNISSKKLLKEQELKKQHDFLKRVIESLTHPFYVIDAETHKITMANKSANLGEISEDSTCYNLTHRRCEPCNGSEHPCPLQKVKKTKRPVVVEHIHYDDDGNMRFLEVHAYPVFDSAGNVIQMIEYDLDITDQKWIEKQLEIESKRARLYLDLLAHDITNQLQIIWSCTELIGNLLDSKESSNRVGGLIDNIYKSMRISKKLILRARSTEQLAATPLFERNLNRTIFECIEIVSEEVDDFCGVVSLHVDDAIVLADKFLEQLLCCLIENAVVHNPEKKKIVWISLIDVRGGYEISVADNGPGLEDALKERIFNPLHRVGGMGLHISSEIAEKFGGRLSVRDRVKGLSKYGAEFVVYLPIIGRLYV